MSRDALAVVGPFSSHIPLTEVVHVTGSAQVCQASRCTNRIPWPSPLGSPRHTKAVSAQAQRRSGAALPVFVLGEPSFSGGLKDVFRGRAVSIILSYCDTIILLYYPSIPFPFYHYVIILLGGVLVFWLRWRQRPMEGGPALVRGVLCLPFSALKTKTVARKRLHNSLIVE